MPPDKDTPKLAPELIARLERWVAGGAVTARPEPAGDPAGFVITEEERSFWSFQPIVRPAVPRVRHQDQVRTPIDAFLLARLEEHGESFAKEADPRMLLRRASFDFLGLPPSPEEVAQFLADQAPGAFDRAVDRMLKSPHYGERWGRHWLDVAGYADSDGASGDKVRPYAYRFRDYVIRSFNADKPFDLFIREQLAGDELAGPVNGEPTPDQAEKLIATGFLQMAPDTTASAEDRISAHNQLLADSLEIISSSLFGLTIGCARCHDHRYDPVSQEDYYRFRAIFEPAYAPSNWRDQNRQVAWFTEEDRKNREQSHENERRGVVLQTVEKQLEKVPASRRAAAREAVEKPDGERTAEQRKLVADYRLNVTLNNVTAIDRTAKQELQRLEKQYEAGLKRAGFIYSIRESGVRVPTALFIRGDPHSRGAEVQPGELSILGGDKSASIPEKDSALPGSGRRLAYAKRLTDGSHPLLARVIVNRVWMHHFGRGLTTTPSDFGLQGDRPSHPELLDWLAREFMDHGWSVKHLHRVIVESTAYRQGGLRSENLRGIDPDNRLLGGFRLNRLDAEMVRDAILAVSGELNLKAFGTPVPVMTDPAGEIVVGAANPNEARPLTVVSLCGEENRRSVYIQTRRTTPLTFTEMFDAPVMDPNCKARSTSTAAPQSLVLMNSPFVLQQSLRFAERIRRDAGGGFESWVRRAWELAFSRPPAPGEMEEATAFLRERTDYFRKHPPVPVEGADIPGSRSQDGGLRVFDILIERASRTESEVLALSLLCQMLLSSNEFLYSG